MLRAAGAAMKLDANRIAEIAISATEMVAWRVDAWTELSCRFFIKYSWVLPRLEGN